MEAHVSFALTGPSSRTYQSIGRTLKPIPRRPARGYAGIKRRV